MPMTPDPTFYASPRLAMEAPPENFAYTLLLSPDASQPNALAVIDVKPGSPTYGAAATLASRLPTWSIWFRTASGLFPAPIGSRCSMTSAAT